MEFSHTQSLPLAEIPRLSLADFRKRVLDRVATGWRVMVAFLGPSTAVGSKSSTGAAG